MRHAVLETQSEFRNASAEEKLSADIPNVSTSSRVASPTISSSSTTAINGLSFTAIIPGRPPELGATLDRFDKQSDNFPKRLVGCPSVSFSLYRIPAGAPEGGNLMRTQYQGPFILSATRINSASEPTCIFRIT